MEMTKERFERVGMTDRRLFASRKFPGFGGTL